MTFLLATSNHFYLLNRLIWFQSIILTTTPLQKNPPKQVSKKQGSVDLNFSIKRMINSYPISEQILIFSPYFFKLIIIYNNFQRAFHLLWFF